MQHSDVARRLHLHTFVLFDRKRIAAYLRSPVHRISFAVGPVIYAGALLFVLGKAAQCRRGYWDETWSEAMTLALVRIPILVRCLCCAELCCAALACKTTSIQTFTQPRAHISPFPWLCTSFLTPPRSPGLLLLEALTPPESPVPRRSAP
jgi:hypothetical protein